MVNSKIPGFFCHTCCNMIITTILHNYHNNGCCPGLGDHGESQVALRNEVSRKGASAAPLSPLQVGNAASLKLILRSPARDAAHHARGVSIVT